MPCIGAKYSLCSKSYFTEVEWDICNLNYHSCSLRKHYQTLSTVRDELAAIANVNVNINQSCRFQSVRFPILTSYVCVSPVNKINIVVISTIGSTDTYLHIFNDLCFYR